MRFTKTEWKCVNELMWIRITLRVGSLNVVMEMQFR